MSTVAVIGSAGQLGSDLVALLGESGRHKVVALSHRDIEVANPRSVRGALGAVRPDILVNCAAFVRVDDCEDQPETAFLVNAVGALYVAQACRESNALCVYISTDYVFDGQKGTPYTEEDCPHPINVYGASKLAGEHLVRQACPRSLVVRTAGLFGLTGARGKYGNFIESVIAKHQRREPIRVVYVIRTPPTSSPYAPAC